MKSSEIKEGGTYLFLGTFSPARKHLEGQPFTVQEIKTVWRRFNRQSRRTLRFFDANGIGARADELQPLNDIPPGHIRCAHCAWTGPPGDLEIDDTHAPNRVVEVCPNCGETPAPF